MGLILRPKPEGSKCAEHKADNEMNLLCAVSLDETRPFRSNSFIFEKPMHRSSILIEQLVFVLKQITLFGPSATRYRPPRYETR